MVHMVKENLCQLNKGTSKSLSSLVWVKVMHYYVVKMRVGNVNPVIYYIATKISGNSRPVLSFI